MFAVAEANGAWDEHLFSAQRGSALCCSEHLVRGSVGDPSRASTVCARSTLCRYRPCPSTALQLVFLPLGADVFCLGVWELWGQAGPE